MDARAPLAVALALAAALPFACGGGADDPPPAHPAPRAPAPSPEPPRAVVPTAPPTDYAPSPASVRDRRELPGDALSAIDRCSVCHADIFAQWSQSAHRFSSLDNPFYLPAFRGAREQRGAAITRWCGACHDPGLLFAGDLDQAVIDRSHERAQLGVGCLLCHSIDRVHDATGDGNYRVSPDPVVYPPRVGEDRDAVARHRERLTRPLLRTAEFCASCHKVGITEAITGSRWLRGQNEYDVWQQSAYAGNDAERHDPDAPRRVCQDCHMPMVPAPLGDRAATDGRVRSHRFAGGHTALAAWVGAPEMMAAEREALVGAARIDLFRAPSVTAGGQPLEAAPPVAGEELAIDVVMVNERVGHRFPAGTADVADTWVELTVRDRRGLVAESGLLTPTDPGPLRDDAHRLELRPVDDQGHAALMRDPHRYRAVAYDTTLPPRASRVVRYTWRVPSSGGPYTVTARLLHRRIANPFLASACRTATADQGRPCPTTWPVTEVASVSVTGNELRRAPALDASLTAPWRRWYDHGRALVEWNLQERVGEARASLDAARRDAPDRAEPWVETARLAIREGRTDEAHRWLDEAARRAPNSPAIPYLRGVAGSDVWRWAETVAPLGEAHRLVPGNVRVAEMYANSLGIAGRHQEALRVIREGLAIEPERPQLHNLQAIELDALGAHDEAAVARRAWERHRTPDDLPGLRSRCKRDVPHCALETIPLHAHALRAVR